MVHVQAGEIGHDLVGGRHAEHERDRHVFCPIARYLLMMMCECGVTKLIESAARTDRVSAGVTEL